MRVSVWFETVSLTLVTSILRPLLPSARGLLLRDILTESTRAVLWGLFYIFEAQQQWGRVIRAGTIQVIKKLLLTSKGFIECL